jgi:hypothetical protein
MYSFANRTDTQVVDEPLFGYFLKYTGVWRPSREEVLDVMETDATKIISGQLLAENNKPVVFYKHIANHFIGLDWSYFKNTKNIILTRHPKDVLLSFSKNLEELTLLDTAYGQQIELMDYFIDNDIEFILFDSNSILIEPEMSIKSLCKHLGIPFQKNMLKWSAGPRKEDGVWAKYWYKSLHQSTGFMPYKEKQELLPKKIKPLYEECMSLYERLKKHELR